MLGLSQWKPAGDAANRIAGAKWLAYPGMEHSVPAELHVSVVDDIHQLTASADPQHVNSQAENSARPFNPPRRLDELAAPRAIPVDRVPVSQDVNPSWPHQDGLKWLHQELIN